MTDVSAGQSLTGERTLPGIWHENYWFRRHEIVYLKLSPRLTGTTSPVLDAGCGEGYGSALLDRSTGGVVIGLDYDYPTLAHARQAYPGVAATQGNLVAMPFREATLGAVVSLQVVEHLWDQPGFVGECARVTRPGGWVALATPNRLTFSPGVERGEKPLNPFHSNELDADELIDLVTGAGLANAELLGLRHGTRLSAWEADHGSVVAAQLAQPYASWPDDLVRLVRSLTAEDFVLTPEDVETSLDLVVIARKPATVAGP